MFTPSEKKILLLIASCFVVGMAAKKWETHWVEIPELASAKAGQAEAGWKVASSETGREKAAQENKKASAADTASHLTGSSPSSNTTSEPSFEEGTGEESSKTDTLAHKLDINLASRAQLMEIKGIGPITADKIIEYRRVHGPFTRLDQLIKIKGIGKKKLQKMRPFFKI